MAQLFRKSRTNCAWQGRRGEICGAAILVPRFSQKNLRYGHPVVAPQIFFPIAPQLHLTHGWVAPIAVAQPVGAIKLNFETMLRHKTNRENEDMAKSSKPSDDLLYEFANLIEDIAAGEQGSVANVTPTAQFC